MVLLNVHIQALIQPSSFGTHCASFLVVPCGLCRFLHRYRLLIKPLSLADDGIADRGCHLRYPLRYPLRNPLRYPLRYPLRHPQRFRGSSLRTSAFVIRVKVTFEATACVVRFFRPPGNKIPPTPKHAHARRLTRSAQGGPGGWLHLRLRAHGLVSAITGYPSGDTAGRVRLTRADGVVRRIGPCFHSGGVVAVRSFHVDPRVPGIFRTGVRGVLGRGVLFPSNVRAGVPGSFRTTGVPGSLATTRLVSAVLGLLQASLEGPHVGENAVERLEQLGLLRLRRLLATDIPHAPPVRTSSALGRAGEIRACVGVPREGKVGRERFAAAASSPISSEDRKMGWSCMQATRPSMPFVDLSLPTQSGPGLPTGGAMRATALSMRPSMYLSCIPGDSGRS
eukprot:1194611-Prorocentrum_minimum.AAC.15